jgi:hypothetical protein
VNRGIMELKKLGNGNGNGNGIHVATGPAAHG